MTTQFCNDYILTLQRYQSKINNSRPLKVSDIVIINEPKMMTLGQPAVGTITKLTKSNLDNRERTATIKIPASKIHKERIITRDVRYIARLECDIPELS